MKSAFNHKKYTNEQQVLEIIEGIFREIFDDPHLSITMSTTNKDLEAWDSYQHILILAAVEEHFGVRLDLIDAERYLCISELVHSLLSLL